MGFIIMISVYGSTGFIGSTWMKMNFKSVGIDKKENSPHSSSNEILYLISTTDNYNVFEDSHKDIETNLIKLVDVLDACRKTNKDIIFNFVSSWFVYGLNSSLNTKENDICDPRGFYSITKRAAEQLLISYCETFDIKYRIFRLTNIIGPNDKGISKKKNAIQYMMKLLKNGEEVNLYDDGSNIRDYMDVSDTCRAIECCILNAPPNQIINISNNDPCSIGKIIKYSKEKLSSKSKINSIETPHFHKVVQVKDVCLNNEKLLSYGYKPKTNILESVDLILKEMKGV